MYSIRLRRCVGALLAVAGGLGAASASAWDACRSDFDCKMGEVCITTKARATPENNFATESRSCKVAPPMKQPQEIAAGVGELNVRAVVESSCRGDGGREISLIYAWGERGKNKDTHVLRAVLDPRDSMRARRGLALPLAGASLTTYAGCDPQPWGNASCRPARIHHIEGAQFTLTGGRLSLGAKVSADVAYTQHGIPPDGAGLAQIANAIVVPQGSATCN